jgi:hypothetical protein
VIIGARVTLQGTQDDAEAAYEDLLRVLDEWATEDGSITLQVQREPDLFEPDEEEDESDEDEDED